jgi:tRNA G10  N-methylase Trm11
MVRLAGAPPDRDGGRVLVDPCCGSGTILEEAAAVGWWAMGGDVDGGALDVAAANVDVGAPLARWDARSLPLPDASAAAVVANLPFGRRFEVDGKPDRWYRLVLDELGRVVSPHGAVVVMVPDSPEVRRAVDRATVLRLEQRLDVRLLGVDTAVWRFLPSQGAPVG